MSGEQKLAPTVYTEAELMAECDYATPQVVGEHRLHGGFDADGRYLPPRSRFRPEAIAAWTRATVAGETFPGELSTFETVPTDTEAAAATSRMLTPMCPSHQMRCRYPRFADSGGSPIS